MSATVVLAIPPPYDHVVIVIEENEQYQAIIGSPFAPYINSLAVGGVSFTNMRAVVHPSQPNYLELFSGSNQGVVDDFSFGTKFTTPNLAASLIAAGKTFAAYCESLPAEGDITSDNVNNYVKRHCPWVAWMPGAEPLGPNQLPRSLHKPMTAFPGDFSQLPTVAFVIPNNENNMHSGPTETADAWLRIKLGAYAEWAKTNNSLLIITWDEDSFQQANRIPTIFYGANLQPWQNNGAWSLHNLLRTLEDMYGLPHAGRAALVPAITGSFPGESPLVTRVFSPDTTGPGTVTDTMVTAQSPTTAFGSSVTLRSLGATSQPLVKLTGIFGSTSANVPPAAAIASAKLIATTANDTQSTSANSIGAHRMLIPWSDSSTYSSLTTGVQLNDLEASSVADFSVVPSYKATAAVFDVTPSLIAFRGGAPNHGWVFSGGANDWIFHSAENATFRPALEVSYEADLVGFDAPQFVVTPGGVEARVNVHRLGVGAAAVTVTYVTANDIAVSGSDYTSASGSLSWPSGDLSSRTIIVQINADTIVEGAETFRILLQISSGQAALDQIGAVDIVIDEKPYDLWRWLWFGASANNPESLPDANPDGDILTNLQEYWYGLDPRVFDVVFESHPVTFSISSGRLRFRFWRNKMATDLIYTVQVSEDLLTWADGPSYSATSSTPNTPVATEEFRFDYPDYESIYAKSVKTTSDGALFMRLQVTQAP